MSKSRRPPLDEGALLCTASTEKVRATVRAALLEYERKLVPPLDLRDVFGLLVEGVRVYLEQEHLVRGRLRIEDFEPIRRAAFAAVASACPELTGRAFNSAGPLVAPETAIDVAAEGYGAWLESLVRLRQSVVRERVLPVIESREGCLIRLWYRTGRRRFASLPRLEQDTEFGMSGTEIPSSPRALLASLVRSPTLFSELVWVDRDGLFRVGKRQLRALLGPEMPGEEEPLLDLDPVDPATIVEPEEDQLDMVRQVEEVRRALALRAKQGSPRRLVLEHLFPLLAEEVSQAEFARQHGLDPGQVSRLLEESVQAVRAAQERGQRGE